MMACDRKGAQTHGIRFLGEVTAMPFGGSEIGPALPFQSVRTRRSLAEAEEALISMVTDGLRERGLTIPADLAFQRVMLFEYRSAFDYATRAIAAKPPGWPQVGSPASWPQFPSAAQRILPGRTGGPERPPSGVPHFHAGKNPRHRPNRRRWPFRNGPPWSAAGPAWSAYQIGPLPWSS
jgi:hypothetical protein